MFAIIAAGRQVQTEYQQVNATHIIFPLPNYELVDHIVVFLAGAPLPEGLVGVVYFSLPAIDGQPSWQYLGYVGNEKPSAVFRLFKLKGKAAEVMNSASVDASLQNLVAIRRDETALIGISLESLDTVKNVAADERVRATSVAGQVAEFMSKMLENFSNYVCSFSVTPIEIQSKPTESYIPVSAFNKWCENMQRRLTIDPYFWKTR